MQRQLETLSSRIAECMPADRGAFARRLSGLRRRAKQGQPFDRGLNALEKDVTASCERLARRRERLPKPDYPEALPVSARREAIAAAIARHQVVVVAGETGSGKTTQLPKICLELGRGVDGLIGHTQPRRIAARSVAGRIAGELGGKVGEAVGFKVRFTDHVGEGTYIKLMTDGILLAEVQSDPELRRYDTLIIDEAHERSLNIDFLLGYLKQLLPRRPDLKLIITSATINTEAFSRFFGEAPVIEVSGRTYPVEVRYRPLSESDEDERDRDLPQQICEAVDELAQIDPLGDTLVFLPGEREIREAAEALRKHRMRDTEVIPLFSRLSAAEQDRVFQTHRGRRIVLATNVAETSLTVPGIRFVIDSGYARISRYSHRTKVQRLPIEAISQASANQRAGRCGRLGPGVCIRLYSEEDFTARPEHTDPEILRTNLASVILQMANLGLGDVEAFPFMAPPDRRFVTDGYRLLQELGAVDAGRALTPIGRKLVRLPVDPRIGRMLLAAGEEGCVEEVAIIAAALSIQDPRERPLEKQTQADQAHARFRDEDSDFAAFLNLWNYYHEQARHLSNSKLRRTCKAEYLSYVRMREWHEIHGQLLALARELGLGRNPEPAAYDALHRALLTGLLSHVAVKDEEPRKDKKGREKPDKYLGARNMRLSIFPGSGLAKKSPKWLMAAELVETSRLFARNVARIDPAWLERIGAHLLKRSYSEPHWEKRAAQVAAFEQVSLYGLIVVPRRKVNFGPVDPVLSRELFIRHALVAGEYRSEAPFFAHNRALVQELEELEAKARRRDLLVDEQTLYAFYERLVPAGIYSGRSFERWRREAERDAPRLLFLTREALMQQGAETVSLERFPDSFLYGNLRLPLEYHFEPGHEADGVTVVVPLAVLGQLAPEPFDWLVPGLLEEKVIALIKSLPKSLRRNFVPAVNFARAALESLRPEPRPLRQALARQLLRMTGVEVPEEAWDESALPLHLKMNFRAVDQNGRPMDQDRDLELLKARLAGKVRRSLEKAPDRGIEREGLTRWDLDTLPESVEVRRQGLTVRAWPALEDRTDSVAIRLCESPERAERMHREGLRRLLLLENRDKVRYLLKELQRRSAMCLHHAPLGRCEPLCADIVDAAAGHLMNHEAPRDAEAFKTVNARMRDGLADTVKRVAEHAEEALAVRHRVARRLKGSVSPRLLEPLGDVKQQLDRLVFPGFVRVTPLEWLEHLPRYLAAIERRLEKLERDPQRDRQALVQVLPLWEKVWGRLGDQPDWEALPPDLIRLRFLLEEFRVSLFAQELKTAEPVSVQRLERLWKELP